jgi:hypothetical protein
VLHEAAQGLGVSDDAVLGLRRDEHASAQTALVILTRKRVHLAAALQVDVLALPLIRIDGVVNALADEAGQADELGKGPDLLLGRVPQAELFLRLGGAGPKWDGF